jgi:hypothetical protein
MKQQSEIKHVVDRLFDALVDVKVEIALEALGRVIEEFQRAQDEPKIPSRFRSTE